MARPGLNTDLSIRGRPPNSPGKLPLWGRKAVFGCARGLWFCFGEVLALKRNQLPGLHPEIQKRLARTGRTTPHGPRPTGGSVPTFGAAPSCPAPPPPALLNHASVLERRILEWLSFWSSAYSPASSPACRRAYCRWCQSWLRAAQSKEGAGALSALSPEWSSHFR